MDKSKDISKLADEVLWEIIKDTNIPELVLNKLSEESTAVGKSDCKVKNDNSELTKTRRLQNHAGHLNLYIHRRENRLKQRELAKIVGIHSVTYSNKENGKADFELQEAFKLADYFGTTVDKLFNNKNFNKENKLT